MAPDDDPSDEGTSDTEAERRTSDVSLSLNAALELLAHHQRREILRYLIDDTDHVTSIDELVTHLLDCEADRTNERPGHDQLEMQLFHLHLPKLTEARIVEYDARSKEIRYWPNESLEDLLESVQSYERE